MSAALIFPSGLSGIGVRVRGKRRAGSVSWPRGSRGSRCWLSKSADFGALYATGKGSARNRRGTSSAKYERSRILADFLRLTKVRASFAWSNPSPPRHVFRHNAIAGRLSVPALYNVRDFEFVYITRSTSAMPSKARCGKNRYYQPLLSRPVSSSYVRSEWGQLLSRPFTIICCWPPRRLMVRALAIYLRGTARQRLAPRRAEAAFVVSASGPCE